MGAIVAAEEQPLSTKRVISTPFRVIGKILRAIFWAALVVAIITAGITGVWLMGKVETGAGEMTRLEAGRVYIKLAWRQEPRNCRDLFLMGTINSLIVSPLVAIDEAFEVSWVEGDGNVTPEEITWWQIPSRTFELLGIYMNSILHVGPAGWDHPYRCRLPLPQDWTPELIE
jgi:hypothetical protein